MRSRRGLPDLTTRTPTAVGEAGSVEIGENVLVPLGALALANRFTVPRETEPFQIAALAVEVFGADRG